MARKDYQEGERKVVRCWCWRKSVFVVFQNLEMIKVREEEAGSMGKVIRKFTYKGEVEIDAVDDNRIEVRRKLMCDVV